MYLDLEQVPAFGDLFRGQRYLLVTDVNVSHAEVVIDGEITNARSRSNGFTGSFEPMELLTVVPKEEAE